MVKISLCIWSKWHICDLSLTDLWNACLLLSSIIDFDWQSRTCAKGAWGFHGYGMFGDVFLKAGFVCVCVCVWETEKETIDAPQGSYQLESAEVLHRGGVGKLGWNKGHDVHVCALQGSFYKIQAYCVPHAVCILHVQKSNIFINTHIKMYLLDLNLCIL